MDTFGFNQVLVAGNQTADFFFELGGLKPSALDRIFSDWKDGRSYDLVKDRIIQKYLEVVEYNAEVRLYPFSFMPIWMARPQETQPTDAPGRTVCFLLQEATDQEKTRLGHCARLMQAALTWLGPGMQGHASIDVWDIYQSVLFIKDQVAALPDSTLTISEISKHFWPYSSKNLKGTIHNWMQGMPYKKRERIPVFAPEVAVKRASSKGCRLSISDITTVGLLLSLFAHGMKSYDFRFPSEWMIWTCEEVAKAFNSYVRKAHPGLALTIPIEPGRH